MNLEEYCISLLNKWDAKTIEEFIIAVVNLDDDKMDALTPELKNCSLYQKMIIHRKIFAIISKAIREKEDSNNEKHPSLHNEESQ